MKQTKKQILESVFRWSFPRKINFDFNQAERTERAATQNAVLTPPRLVR